MHARAAVADLVEHHRSAVRGFEEPLLIADGAGEAPSHVPEQLGFEERVWNAGAVDGTERLGPPRALPMEHPGRQVFPDTTLPGNQDFALDLAATAISRRRLAIA